jgi:uncharacterized membrane protein YeaQ/YmgE (transglycosylase-associated protein family)
VIVVLVLAILTWGLFVGGLAWLLRGGPASNVSFMHHMPAGVAGSYAGAMLASLLAGDALRLRWMHLAGSIAASVVLLLSWRPAPRPPHPRR